MGRYFSKPDIYFSMRWAAGLQKNTLYVGNAPCFTRGLRILFVSDIHLRAGISDHRLQQLMQTLAAEKAHLLLLGGDLGEGTRQLRRLLQQLSQIKPPLGIFCCPGNNDREAFENVQQLQAQTEAFGVHMLVNRAHTIEWNGGKIVLAGIDEYKHGTPVWNGLLPAANENCYRVLLSHHPTQPPAESMPDLMLCGHTHGGQINMFGITPYVLPWMERREMPGGPLLVRGTMQNNGALTLVSSGIGCSKLPVRLGARPEIHVLEFTGNTPVGD